MTAVCCFAIIVFVEEEKTSHSVILAGEAGKNRRERYE